MNDLGIGHIFDDDKARQRDAIHMAVAPVVAGEGLVPGQPIAFLDGGIKRVSANTLQPIGIVDPFLRAPILEGESFWMFLFPNTITALRHDWSHPAFAGSLDHSRAWIQEFAAELGLPYQKLMDAALRWHREGEYTYDNSENYKGVGRAKWSEFWSHYEIISGWIIPPNQEDDTFFTCSC